jgi:hypothetical protein
MRAVALLVPVVLSGCAAPQREPPSLAPRAAEAIDPRVPVPESPVQSQASADLRQQLDALVAEAVAGDSAFRAVAANAEQAAASASAPESESWIVAQQALSSAVAARAPVARALGEVDALAATRIQRLGGISAADMAAIQAASARIAEIDARQSALIDRLQARLRG